MSDQDLISAAPGFNSNAPYFYKPELSSTPAASKETLSSKLKAKQGLHVAPQHKKALQDQAQNQPDKPELASDSTVTVTNQAGFKALVSSKQTTIKGLTFDCGRVTVQTMAQLIKKGWPALRSLNLSSSGLGADAMQHLVEGLWPDLMHLDLSNNSLDEEAMFLMSDLGDKWRNLETLDLSKNQLNAGAMVHLIKPKFSKLQSLDLRHNNLDFMAVSEVIKGGWPTLKKIALSRNLTEDSCHLLVKEPTANKIEWPCLEHLDLSCNELDARAIQKLTKGSWPWLNTLILFDNTLDAAALSKLSKANWPHMRYLDLSGNRLKADGISKLVKANFRKLEVLKIADTDLDSAAVPHLIKGRWSKLLVVDISTNKIDGTAITSLITADWPLLETLKMAYNELGDDMGLFANGKPTAWGVNKLDPPGRWNWPCLKVLDITKTPSNISTSKNSPVAKDMLQMALK